MFNDEGIVSVGDLLESLGLKQKSTETGRRESDGSKPGARVEGLFPPYFFFPRSDSTQSLDSRDGDAPQRRLDVTAATIAIEEKLVEKVGVGFSHAKEIAEDVLRAIDRTLSEVARVKRVESDQLFHFDTLDGMADFAKDFVPENDTEHTAKEAASPDRPRRDPAAAAATAAAIRANVEANAGSNTGTSRGARRRSPRRRRGTPKSRRRSYGASPGSDSTPPRFSGRSRRCTTFTWERRTSVRCCTLTFASPSRRGCWRWARDTPPCSYCRR